MRKSRRSGFDWRKPRYHRSDPNTIKDSAVKSNKSGRLIAIDNCTRWKSPISRDTFDDLCERGLLSDEQIKEYLKREAASSATKKRRGGKAKEHKDLLLIIEIAKLDLKTKEGSAAFKDLLKKRPEALRLIGEAQKLKAAK